MHTILALFISNSIQFKLPEGLLSSLCYVESRHIASIVHKDDGPSHSYGICQVKFETAKYLGFTGTVEQLMNPKINIYYAGKYLQKQILRYNDINKGIVAYNRGNSNKLTRSIYSDKVNKQWGDNK